MSRAAAERTPGREVRPGVSAATWWGDVMAPDVPTRPVVPARPPAQDAAQFSREDVTGTFANRAQGSVLSVEALREMQRVLTERSVAMPRAMVVPPWVAREAARFASDPYYPDGLGLAWAPGYFATPEERAAARERRAAERTGRALVAWLIGRWRR